MEQICAAMAEQASDTVFFAKDRSGHYTYMNPAGAALLGRTPNELLGRNDAELFGERLAGVMDAEDARVLTGEMVEADHALPTPAGVRLLQVVKYPLRDESGGVTGIVGIARDVTERRALEAHLAQRERYLRALADVQQALLDLSDDADPYAVVLPALLEVSRADRAYVFENSTAADGSLVATQVAEVVAPQVSSQIANPALREAPYDPDLVRWRETLALGEAISGRVADFPASERQLLEPQGIHSLLALPLIVDGRFHGFVGFDDCDANRDWEAAEVALMSAAAGALSATLARRQVAALRRAEEDKYRSWFSMIRLMCDTVPDLIWAKDVEKRFLFTNRAICERLLRADDTDEPVGKTDMHFAERERARHPERTDWHTFGEVCADSDSVVLASRRAERFNEYGNVGGEFLYLDVYKAPLFDAQGELIGAVGCGRDVTAERQVSRRLGESEAQMKAVLRALPDLLFRINSDGVFLDARAPDPGLLMLPREQIIGARIEDALPAELAALTRKHVAATLRRRRTRTFEFSLPMRNEERRYEARMVPCGDDEVLAIVRDVTERHRDRRRLETSATNLQAMLDGAIAAMGTVVEMRDPYTAGHELRVTRLADAVAAELDLDDESRRALHLAAQVHDVGKIGVPAEVLSRPGRLLDAEFAMVKAHPVTGREILAAIPFDAPVADIVYQHHERLDGSGYPLGLTGDETLLEARILAVADVVEAMASHRPYRPALGLEAALAEIRSGAGTSFDADVVSACERVLLRGEFDLGG